MVPQLQVSTKVRFSSRGEPHYFLSKLEFKKVSTNFNSGYFAANKQYIAQLPIRAINFSDPTDAARHERMEKLVEGMLGLHRRLGEARLPQEKEIVQRQITATDEQIDALVYELYGLTEEEIKIVEGR